MKIWFDGMWIGFTLFNVVESSANITLPHRLELLSPSSFPKMPINRENSDENRSRNILLGWQ